MLETLREYALEQLQTNGELETLRRQHANYYLQFADVVFPANASDDPTPESFDRIQEEKGNLGAALAWSQSATGTAQMGLRLSEVAAYISHLGEWQIWMERMLAHAEAEGGFDPHTRGRVLGNLGTGQAWHGDYAGAESKFLASLEVFRRLKDRRWTVSMLERSGWAAREQGDLTTARARLAEALELTHELKNNDLTFAVSNTLAETMTMQGDTDAARHLLETILPLELGADLVSMGDLRARDFLESVLPLESRLADYWPLAWTLNHLGHIAQIEESYEHARRLHEESLRLFREMQGEWGIIEALHCLGETSLAQGNQMISAKHFSESLTMAQKLGYRAGAAWCLAGMAGGAVLNEEPERAAWLWGAAEALRQSIGAREAPASRATHERLKAEVRNQLGEAVFNAKWAEGQAASVQQAIVEATL